MLRRPNPNLRVLNIIANDFIKNMELFMTSDTTSCKEKQRLLLWHETNYCSQTMEYPGTHSHPKRGRTPGTVKVFPFDKVMLLGQGSSF